MPMLSVILAIFVYGMITAMLGAILPNLSERFQLTPRQNGAIAFAQALGLILPSLGVGPLLDAEGKKVGLVLGLALIWVAPFALPPSSGYRPRAHGSRGFTPADASAVLGRPMLFLLGFFLFLYVSCEVGIWNWRPRHVIAQGIPESRALNILSLGFALGLLIGRLVVSPILIHVPAVTVTLAASIAMAITTLLVLMTRRPFLATLLVALAGLAMAPVFPTTLAIVGDLFLRMSSTAIGCAIPCGWVGLAVSSRVIGAIAGGDARRLRKALLVIPASATLMIVLSLMIRGALHD